MKIRIGFGLGTQTLANDHGSFGDLVDALEDLRFDSLWLSERLTGDAPDPLVALSFAAGRTSRLKLGTSVLVLPGRNPVVLAKEMASLDRLSNGRFLPAVGLGAPSTVEQRAFGVGRKERAPWFDEALALMRRLWTEDDVHHDGERFHVDGLTLRPRPVQQPIEVWLGGQAPSELRRVGRVGDGWLPSFATVDDVEGGWATVNETAAEHGRRIDAEHLGVLVSYAQDEIPELMRHFLAQRLPDSDPAEVIPVGFDALRAHLEAMIRVGASKFVVMPLSPTPGWDSGDWTKELTAVIDAVGDLQN